MTNKVMLSLAALWMSGCIDQNLPDECQPTHGGVEWCDGVDNDCDEEIDEDCCTVTNGGVEDCTDTIDNDCDGQVNEGCPTGDCTDGEQRGCGGTPEAGACLQTCIMGEWAPCTPTGSGDERCGDGIDNDCDGDIDEMCECAPGDERPCGGSPDEGLCAETCTADGRWSPCAATDTNPGVEQCDGLDNDCDGQIDNADCDCDEGDAPIPCGGTPEQRNCQQACVDGHWGECTPVEGSFEEDICGDGTDNDCDGQIDEPEPCELADCGTGEARCEGTVRGECNSAAWHCRPGDEDTQPCSGEDRGICDPGTHTRECRSDCTWSGWGTCEGVVTAESHETCNGEDDDCDGVVDEDVVGGDAYGSNGRQDACYSLGDDPDLWVYPVLTGASGVQDWFCFRGIDNFSLLVDEKVVVDLTNIPGGYDLDIALYRLDATGGLEELATSEASGNADEHIDWRASIGDEDDGTYFVAVTGYTMGPEGRVCYSLYINGLN